MAETHVISALVTKYGELSGKLKACEKEAEQLRVDLSHIDAAIRVFKADYDTSAIIPRRPRRSDPRFKKGVFIRTALDILRTASDPLTARELAKRTLEYQGISQPDERAIEQLRRGLNGGLMKRLKEGSVIADASYPKRWVIIHKD